MKAFTNSKLLIEIAKEVIESTTYPIFSHHSLYPEQYQFSSASLDGKKALLIKMAPFLTNAEKQRQADAEACETYTQCKTTKSKGSYEYFDIHTNRLVRCSEYEKR